MYTRLILLICCLGSAAGVLAQEDNPQLNKSPFLLKAGRVVYAVNSVRGQGTKELVFDQWGYRQRETTRLTPTDTANWGSGRYETRILTPDRNWQINNQTKAGLKLEVRPLERSPLVNARYQVSGEPILGYKCMKVKKQYTTAWLYEGVIMKLEIRDPTTGQIVRTEKAVEADFTYEPPAGAFEVPEGIEFY